MAGKWRPTEIVVGALGLWQRRFSDAIRSASPQRPHRAGNLVAVGRGGIGGTLANAVRSAAILSAKPWGGVVELAKLGQKLYWFLYGTQTGGRVSRVGRVRSRKRTGGTERQIARDVMPDFDADALARELEEDAFANYAERDAREAA